MKIKCIKSIGGSIIPINQIAVIGCHQYSHFIWPSNISISDAGYEIDNKTYQKLLKELEIL